jgi:uncharacterized protein YndB with AHSA1/START domain
VVTAAAQDADQARVQVTVAVPVEVAFRVFTERIDQWWRRGPKFRHAGSRAGVVHIEPGVDGRVFESIENDGQSSILEIGRVRVWEPPERLVFSWRNMTFAAHEHTEVEVRFLAAEGGTTVEVTHRGWSALRADHPVRHGLAPADFVRMIGFWWRDQAAALREVAAGTAS